MTETERVGRWGEVFTARYLRDNGYRIVAPNFRVNSGEIDLIAVRGRTLCFVEVKTRLTDTMLPPSAAVDAAKRQRIRSASLAFVARHPKYSGMDIRYDVAEVTGFGCKGINYIENAFD